ncbi:MAG TPA: DUF1194 domain-containing protein [Stellaceae bacterium]|nr:DUF1194 domain-containing protein [Stellaceae bacterium]
MRISRRELILGPLVLGAGLLPGPRAKAEGERGVDLALVLSVDVSGSVNEQRFSLQRNGYALAFESPEVAQAITAGPHRAIAVTLAEWSGVGQQRQLIEWTILDNADSAASFGSALAEVPRAYAEMTALGDAIDFSAGLFRARDFGETRRVIDVSGDGRTNAGMRAEAARDRAVARGITINGLPILAEEPDLDRYYRNNVIGGEGAFLVIARDFKSFAEAIRTKLVREIADHSVLGRQRPRQLA